MSSIPHKVRRPGFITVGQFFQENQGPLKLKLIGENAGSLRKIQEPSINRPGLALSGFFDYFAFKRVQVIGNSELAFLEGLDKNARLRRYEALCGWDIPCIVVARGRIVPEDLIQAANKAGISVYQTSMVTMKFINLATMRLDWAFSPSTTAHGSMVDVQGIGVLIAGPSGSGKSESVIGLLQRGASLVADDAVRLRLSEEREVVGSSPDITRSKIEVRGLGILDVARLFGVGSVRLSKRLDLIVHLRVGIELHELERVGAEVRTEDILGLPIPSVDLPVAPGRDISGLIELAALNFKLKAFGYDSAADFNETLLKKMANDQLG
ncbi:MAG: HPr kinase/phosphorylase [Verrucomicrobiaceae bacterium]|nr:HPr kinase/phosphorylase [Verrucomicrobiaceae bacterium]MDB6118009.1 HPr kinase/phosphorylase [Verrucomicrobiaceae bacterium]